MNYVAFIGTEGKAPPEALEVMQRELPAWAADVDGRGVRLSGRELDFPETAVTVRVRDGEVLVSDGPFAETKEFVAGFDVLACADLDEAIEAMAASPVARFHPIEIRPFRDGLRLGPGLAAFARRDDSAGLPYLLSMWTETMPWDDVLIRDCDAWRRDAESREVFVLGSALGEPETATTLHVRDGETQLRDGSFLVADGHIAGLDVVSCTDREHAIELAAGHPFARRHAVEVRPFYSE